MSQPQSDLLSLPNEILLQIAKNLRTVQDIENLSKSCQRMSSISHCPELKITGTIDNAEDLSARLLIKYLKPDSKKLRLNFGSRGAFWEHLASFGPLINRLTSSENVTCDLPLQWSKYNLSFNHLVPLQLVAQGLEELVLKGCNIPDNISATCFPNSLREKIGRASGRGRVLMGVME